MGTAVTRKQLAYLFSPGTNPTIPVIPTKIWHHLKTRTPRELNFNKRPRLDRGLIMNYGTNESFFKGKTGANDYRRLITGQMVGGEALWTVHRTETQHFLINFNRLRCEKNMTLSKFSFQYNVPNRCSGIHKSIQEGYRAHNAKMRHIFLKNACVQTGDHFQKSYTFQIQLMIVTHITY